MIDEASVLGWHELMQMQGRAEYLSLLALLAGWKCDSVRHIWKDLML
jgi:hypothetical protein